LKKYFWDYAYLLGIAGAVITLDQWTKQLVRSNLEYGEIWSLPGLEAYARLVHWRNTGAAFGMFQDFGGIFSILAILVSIAILYYFPQVPRHDWPLRLAMGLQLGGAVGNLIDRLTEGHVTDFISVGNFAVFNVADASISLGVAILVIGMWIRERQQKNQQTAAGQTPDTGLSSPAPEEWKGE